MNRANAGGGPFEPAPLATSVIGSHARPGWLEVAVAAAGRGELGPVDIREVMDDAVDLVARPQAHVERHLVIAASARVQAFARLPDTLHESRLDIRMHVFQDTLPLEPSVRDVAVDLLETLDDVPADAYQPFLPRCGMV